MTTTSRTLAKILAAFTICTTIFFSCKKDNNSTDNNNSAGNDSALALSTSAAAADNLYNDPYDVLALTTANNTYLGRVAVNGLRADGMDTVPACTTITVSPADASTYPKTVTVDFGSGCTGWYGVTRSGSIVYNFSGKFKTPGTTVTAVFNNYKVNGYKLEGTYSIKNNSSLANGVLFNSSVTNGKVTYPDGTTWYSYSGTKDVKQTGGIGSTDYSTYVFAITGAHSYASYTGKTLTDSITTALVKASSCQYISAGVVAFTYTGPNVTVKGSLDYGSGCDNAATITIGSVNKSITLPR